MGKPTKIKGRGQVATSLTATNSGGAYVGTSMPIDTNLCTAWVNPGTSFSRWKVREIQFKFEPSQGTTTVGNCGIMVLDDPNQALPSSTANALSTRCATYGPIRNPLILRYTPCHNRWLFTRNAVSTTNDRFELPGRLVFWTDNTSASFSPGVLYMVYVVEFDDIMNANIASQTPQEPTVTRYLGEVPVCPKAPDIGTEDSSPSLTKEDQAILDAYVKRFGSK